MATTLYTTKTLTKFEIEAIREGLAKYFGKELGLKDVIDYDGPWKDSFKIFTWRDRVEFLQKLSETVKLEITPQNVNPDLIKRADMLLATYLEIAPKGVEFKGADAPVNPSNMPPKELLEDMAKKGQIRLEEKEKLKKLSDLQIQEALDQKLKLIQQQQLINQEKAKTEALRKDLIEQKVYVKVTVPENLQKKPEIVDDLTREATIAPRKFIAVAEEQFRRNLESTNLNPLQMDVTAKSAAVAAQKIFSSDKDQMIAAAKFKAVSRPEILAKIITPEVVLPTRKSPKEKTTVEPNITAINEPGFTPLPSTPVYTPASVGRIASLTAQETQTIKDKRTTLETAIKAQNTMRLSQLELVRHFIDPKKTNSIENLNDIRVDVIVNPQNPEEALKAGYEEFDLDKEVLSPHKDQLDQNNGYMEAMDIPISATSDSIKQKVLIKVGEKLTAEIAKLPEDHIVSKAFNSTIVQYGLGEVGLVKSAEWVAVENSFMGNVIVGTGNGRLGGVIQETTGVNLGLARLPVEPVITNLEMGTFVGTGLVLYDTAEIVAGMPIYTAPTITALDFGAGAMASSLGVAGTESITTFTAFGEPVLTSTTAWFGFTEATVAGEVGSAVATSAVATTTTAAAATTAATTTTAAAAATTAGVTTATAAGGVAAAPATGGASLVVAAAVAVGTVVIPKIVHKVQDFFRENAPLILTAIGMGAGMVAGLASGGGLIAGAGIGALSGMSAGVVANGGITAIQAATSTFLSTVSGIFGAISKAFLAAIGPPLIMILVVFPIIVSLILFIINNSAYIVPPTVPDSPFSGISIGGLEADGLCSKEKGPVGVPGPSSSSVIANRAYELTFDLYKGFWCFWNRPPSNNPSPNGPTHPEFPDDTVNYRFHYPTLFDYSTYFSNPIPASGFQGTLFWCTYLVIKSYNENGNSIPHSLFTPTMYDEFKAFDKIMPVSQANSSTVRPGMTVFFHVRTGQNRPGYECNCNHVGVVYSVDRGGFTFVQSNAPLKSQSANFNSAGVGLVGGVMEVKYFGLP